MTKFAEGQKVKVIKDQKDSAVKWVGAVVRILLAYEKYVTVKAIEGENYPEGTEWFVDGDPAYFTEDELEAV